MKKIITITLTILLLIANISPIAQAYDGDGETQSVNNSEIHGVVTDEQNAFLVAVTVTLENAQGEKVATTTTDEKGRYRFNNIKPGIYRVSVELEGFAKFIQEIDLTSRKSIEQNIPLKVFIQEQVEVKNDSAGISTDSDKNLTATVITERELSALPDDPDELLDALKQMAGVDNATVYVNGFREGGRLPSKEAIQQIRINSNPFAPEYSEPGHTRFEIVTKPGTDTFHGGFNMNFNDESLNARQATANFKAPTQMRNYGGYFSGPIIRNRWGFFFDANRRENDDNAFINAIILPTDTLTPTPFVTTLVNPMRSLNVSIRTDYLLTKKHTMGLWYRFSKMDNTRNGGDFSLPETGSTSFSKDNTLRFSLTTIASEHAVNEFRFQINRRSNGSRALTDAPAIIVSEAFTSGGNQGQLFSDRTTDGLEASNDITYTKGKHILKFGFRGEATKLSNIDQSNFGGTFLFGSDFERDAQGNRLLVDGAPVPISSLELYRRVLTDTPGYAPSQFSINRGDPFIGFTQWEYGMYFQDDWKIKPTLSFSYGIRQEFQTHLDDKFNFAPRYSLAWVPDKAKRSTIRTGGGIFYSRLDTGITFNTIRNDGIRQRNFVIAQPNFFPNIPSSFSSAPTSVVSIRVKDESLNAPYQILQTASYERQLNKTMFGTVAYTYTRGVNLLRTVNINAPVRDADNNLVKPNPSQGAILEYQSNGMSNRHELRFGFRTAFSRTFTIFSNYVLASTKSNTDSAGTSPANPYDLAAEYGRSSNDVRHSVFLGGSFTTKYGFRLSPFMNIRSGGPFNITTGRDNNLDTVFSDRPSFAAAGTPGAVETRFGIFNPNPLPGEELIPRNYGDGPSSFNLNMSISKSFGFGPPIGGGFPGMSAQSGGQNNNQNAQNNQRQGGNRGNNNRGNNNNNSAMGQAMNQMGSVMMRGGGGPGGGGPGGGGQGGGGGMMRAFGDVRQKYSLTVNVNINNILNHTNYRFYNGVLTSPLFGRSNNVDNARRIELSLRFGF
ncbi:MAG: carboxypeptidase regulatory-like domain-containing protein [Acidobacteriota bacterium]